MPRSPHDPAAPKRPTNLSVNSDLLAQARALDVNLSQVLEDALAERVRRERRAQWLEQNRQAIDDYNRRVEARGVFSDGLRRF